MELKIAITKAQTDVTTAINDIGSVTTRTALMDIQTHAATAYTDTVNAIAGEFSAVVGDAQFITHVVMSNITAIDGLATDVKNGLKNVTAAFESTVRGFVDLVMQPREIRVQYTLQPNLRSVPKSAPVFEATAETKMSITADLVTVIRPADLTKPSVSFLVDARISDFKIHLFPFAKFLSLDFESVSIRADGHGTPQVDPKIRKIRFGEALTFVQKLQDALPFNKPGNGFFVDVDLTAIRVGYRLGLPTIPIGALVLRAISISASLELPFRNKPARVRFAFAERNRPFNLSVGILGGGGFFAVSLGADKVERLEAALEFGASAELSVGPAHGEAHIFAGIYYDADSSGAKLSGYLRAGGTMDIAGLVSMSVEFYLAFIYIPSTNAAAGEAVVNVSIHIGFFTVDFELRCYRQFQGERSQTEARALPRRDDVRYAQKRPRLVGQVAGPVSTLFAAPAASPSCSDSCGGVSPTAAKRAEFFEPDTHWTTYRSYFVPTRGKNCHA